MIVFRFPFRWGAPVPSVTTPVVTPLWSQLAVGSQQWLAQSPTQKRFEPLYPEGDTGPGWTQVTDVVD